MYSLHDIEVNGLDLAEVLECEIESRAGEHSTLVILARVTEEEFVFEISDCQDLEVLLREGEGRKILFSGILTDIQITESGQVKTVLPLLFVKPRQDHGGQRLVCEGHI